MKTLLFGALAAIVLTNLAAAGGTTDPASFVNDDLRTYYPNISVYQSQFLQGGNYAPGAYNYAAQKPSYAVLWFQAQDQYTFLIHNGAPGGSQASCNSDYLSWWNDGFLRYVKTVNTCNGDTSVIDYGTGGNPIIFLPQRWNGEPWKLQGSSPAVYTSCCSSGTIYCTGSNDWQAEIFGVDQAAPGVFGLHWRTTQTLKLNGSGCAPTTHWQEDYWLVQDLPGPNGPQKGLKRTAGGNRDIPWPSWDIWMDRWTNLP
jgi:hypothetical protein